MEEQSYYIFKIKERLTQKQSMNTSYSMRAFARDLGMHSATLSQILQGKRNLPFKRANEVVERLQLSPKEKRLFMESFYQVKTSLDNIKVGFVDERQVLDESYYTVIAEWEHYAALELFNLKGFEFSPQNISKKLGIKKNRAEVVIRNLLSSKLIAKDSNGIFRSTYSSIKTTEDVSSQAIKKAHESALEIGAQKLNDVDVQLRDFSSITLAVDMDKLPEAKNIIREFRRKMEILFKNTEPTEVFRMAIQFYPLSEINMGSEK